MIHAEKQTVITNKQTSISTGGSHVEPAPAPNRWPPRQEEDAGKECSETCFLGAIPRATQQEAPLPCQGRAPRAQARQSGARGVAWRARPRRGRTHQAGPALGAARRVGTGTALVLAPGHEVGGHVLRLLVGQALLALVEALVCVTDADLQFRVQRAGILNGGGAGACARMYICAHVCSMESDNVQAAAKCVFGT